MVVTVAWPQVDQTALVQDTIELVVQVNGKLRSRIEIPVVADDKTVEAAALADETVRRFIEDKQVRKVIIVPRKLVNIVV
jgi:leucyl-tRNA synthetase